MSITLKKEAQSYQVFLSPSQGHLMEATQQPIAMMAKGMDIKTMFTYQVV